MHQDMQFQHLLLMPSGGGGKNSVVPQCVTLVLPNGK